LPKRATRVINRNSDVAIIISLHEESIAVPNEFAKSRNRVRKKVFYTLTGVVALVLWSTDYILSKQPLLWSGTSYAAFKGPGFFAFAVDSRRQINNGASINDAVCKIVVLDKNLIFFNVGIARVPDLFVTDDVAVEIYTNVPKGPTALKEAAVAFSDRIATLMAGRVFPQQELIRGIFVGLDDVGRPQALYAVFTQTPEGIKRDEVRTMTGQFDYYPLREPLWQEVLKNQTPRIKSLNSAIAIRFGSGSGADLGAALVTTLVQAIINWGNTDRVGGQVSTVIFEPGRDMRWYTKGVCTQN
jgi:hypothetical protein